MNNSTNELSVVYEVNGQTVRLTPSIVQSYIVGSDAKITLQEFKFFTELCKARKLNPFLKEAYCIKYGNEPASIVVSKDIILARAITNPLYDGMESGIIVVDATGDTKHLEGTFKLHTDTLVGGWARVYRKDWKYPRYMSVSFEEVAQRKRDGNLNINWKTKGATMVEKVAKVRALRETFIDELSGMYEAEEIGVEIPSGEAIIIDESSDKEQTEQFSEDLQNITLDELDKA